MIPTKTGAKVADVGRATAAALFPDLHSVRFESVVQVVLVQFQRISIFLEDISYMEDICLLKPARFTHFDAYLDFAPQISLD